MDNIGNRPASSIMSQGLIWAQSMDPWVRKDSPGTYTNTNLKRKFGDLWFKVPVLPKNLSPISRWQKWIPYKTFLFQPVRALIASKKRDSRAGPWKHLEHTIRLLWSVIHKNSSRLIFVQAKNITNKFTIWIQILAQNKFTNLGVYWPLNTFFLRKIPRFGRV